MESEKAFINAIQDGIRDGVKNKLNGYNSPLDKMLADVLAKHDSSLRKMLADAIESAMDGDFRKEIRAAVRQSLAKTLVARFGGELGKQVDALKSDPTTRARMTLAIDAIVKEKTQI